jgi:prepilin-type N-terminal cleavage/methylation domain-containing protein
MKPGRRAAFTLLEMAIVLVIMGLVGTVFYSIFTDYVGEEKIDSAEAALEDTNEGLIGRALVNGTLPDPDPDGTVPDGLSTTRDPWGGEIRYWLADGLRGGQDVLSPGDEMLMVKIYSDAGEFPTGTADRSVANVAYLIASSGPNMQPQVVESGDELNVLSPGGPLQDGSGLEFDDLVRYVGLNELKAKVDAVR